MGIFSRFEGKMEDAVEGTASKMSKAPISPVQIAKKAEKQMRRETMVGAGKEYAPTLYTVLVNPDDDARMFGYYPTLAGETETYLEAKAAQQGLVMDGHPLVRFVVDNGLKHGKFDIIAETVAAPIVSQLRDDEMERYGLAPQRRQQSRPQASAQQQGYASGYDAREGYDAAGASGAQAGYEGYGAYYQQAEQGQAQASQRKPPLPYVPEEEIDRSIDYGEYTFNSEDFEDYRTKVERDDAAAAAAAGAAGAYGAQAAAAAGAYGAQAAGAAGAYGAQAASAQAASAQVAAYGAQGAAAQVAAAQQQQMQPANTVAFTPGSNGGAPDHRAVRARLIDTVYQRVYDLAGSCVTIGRESGNDIVVQDINASRKHAEVRLNAQGIWVISDLGSMNGTRVNGISIASQPLYPGDTVTIGKTEYRFALA